MVWRLWPFIDYFSFTLTVLIEIGLDWYNLCLVNSVQQSTQLVRLKQQALSTPSNLLVFGLMRRFQLQNIYAMQPFHEKPFVQKTWHLGRSYCLVAAVEGFVRFLFSICHSEFEFVILKYITNNSNEWSCN